MYAIPPPLTPTASRANWRGASRGASPARAYEPPCARLPSGRQRPWFFAALRATDRPFEWRRQAAAACACLASAFREAAEWPSRSARASWRVIASATPACLPSWPASYARSAFSRVSSEVVPAFGGGRSTPARRAFDSPIAIACLSNARRACPRARARFPRARIRRPECLATCLRACPSSLFPEFPCLAWCPPRSKQLAIGGHFVITARRADARTWSAENHPAAQSTCPMRLRPPFAADGRRSREAAALPTASTT